ncbi:MAG: AAA family ATPase [Alphaproteobacteria bacterium]|jgi:AAA+ superfamily predicted ATPase
MANEVTRHLIVDLKTGFAYGIKLDAEGNCKAVQPLNTNIETLEGKLVQKFGPLASNNGAPGLRDPQTLPYSQTTYAVELSAEGKTGSIFTIVWPSKKDAEAGILPNVAKAVLPDDLVKARIAPAPKTANSGEGADDDAKLKEALRKIDDMIGLDGAKRDIKQNIAVARFNRAKEDMGVNTNPISRHMVFTGNPGTGKTTFAREVAKVYHALGFIEKPEVHEVKREDLVAGYVGQTALKTKEAIDKAKGGILFIDEAYALSRGSEGGGGGDGKDFGREAIDTLVAAMENMREDLIVIVAGYTEPMKNFIDANPGLKSRFMTYINFEDYPVKELTEIMDFMLKERGYTIEPAARDHAIGLVQEEKDRSKKDFGNGRTVRNLVEKVEKELALRLEEEGKLSKNHGLAPDELKAALTTITLADVQKVSLEGLKVKALKGIGLGASEPANFNSPSALDSVPSAKTPKAPKPKNAFGM